MEQKYILKNCDSFEPKHIFECGQCFRWNENEDGSYTGVFGNNVINVNKINQEVIFKGVCDGDIKNICENYFDLKRDYEKIKYELSNIDNYMKESIKYGSGIRILNQELWETVISFIISANNNIPRIKGIIERLSKKYGNKIVWQNKEYYTFPTVEELSRASIEDLRKQGLGFRDKRVYETTQIFLKNKDFEKKLKEEINYEKIKNSLLELPGVGPKVADCILLFSTLKKLEAFPIDVWIKRVVQELYFKEEKDLKLTNDVLNKLAKEKYGELAGIAQQYLFYWRREA
ncbi:MAG: 8-oxoguanine DNA glycosylase [Clostridia bacterium]|nr:8-oxoguanine DNA glycosylase [Clostridia bacterium]